MGEDGKGTEGSRVRQERTIDGEREGAALGRKSSANAAVSLRGWTDLLYRKRDK